MKNPYTLEELKELGGKVPVVDFLNKRGRVYKERKEELEGLSEEQLLKEMAEDPKLVRRPIVIKGDHVIVGYNEKEFESLLC